MDVQLNMFDKLPEAESTKEVSKFYENLSISKIVVLGGCLSSGLFFVLNQSELGWGQSLIGSILAGFALMAFLATIKKKKLSN